MIIKGIAAIVRHGRREISDGIKLDQLADAADLQALQCQENLLASSIDLSLGFSSDLNRTQQMFHKIAPNKPLTLCPGLNYQYVGKGETADEREESCKALWEPAESAETADDLHAAMGHYGQQARIQVLAAFEWCAKEAYRKNVRNFVMLSHGQFAELVVAQDDLKLMPILGEGDSILVPYVYDTSTGGFTIEKGARHIPLYPVTV